MAGSVNKVILIGNLCADPESRSFQNGGKVANLRVATNESWKDKDGNKQEAVEYHSVSVFSDGLVGICERYLRKGSKIYVEGKSKTRKWKDQSGNDRYSTEIHVGGFGGTITMLDSAGDNRGERKQSYRDEPQDNFEDSDPPF